MRVRLRHFLSRLKCGQHGSVAVEFAILTPIFLLLVFGIMDFGHAWYMDHIVSNASREGARYGTRYTTDASGKHVLPDALNPSIHDWIISKYSSLLPGNANLQVVPGGPGYTSGNPGDDLSVQVTATKTWWVLGKLVPGLGSTETLSSTTWMKVE